MGHRLPTRSDWHYYDDSGYYPYVLLNASEEECAGVQKTLAENGLIVVLAGKSCRPASNGAQYQWYVRLDDDGGQHPPRDKVERILVSCSPPNPQPIILRLLKRVLPSVSTRREIRMLKTALAGQGELLRTLQAKYQSDLDALCRGLRPRDRPQRWVVEKERVRDPGAA